MKIRTKFMLLQFLVVTGFSGSMAFIFTQFVNVDHLKHLELQSIQTRTALSVLAQNTSLFNKRYMYLFSLWEDWESSYRFFNDSYTGMINNPYHRLLGKRASERKRSMAASWLTLKENEIKLLTDHLNEILQDMPEIMNVKGISISKRVSELNGGDNANLIQALSLIENNFDTLNNSLLATISIPTDQLIKVLGNEIEKRTSRLYRITLTISIFIQAGGVFLLLLFSRGFSRNTIELEQTMTQVADGNFNIILNIQSGDEFEDISRHFNSLTQDLWTRIDSMKDMMRDIGNVCGEDADIEQLEEYILKLAIDNTGADAGLIMAVNEDMLVLTRVQGYFPPPMPLPPMVSCKQEYISEWFSTHRIPLGDGILGEVITQGEPRFIKENNDGSLPNNMDPEIDSYINSAIFVPLSLSGKTHGLLALALTRKEAMFTDLDYAYMRSFGDFIALTLDNMQKYHELLKNNQVNREIEIAADIQKTLLPRRLPTLRNAEVAAFSDAAKGVSGDYYDAFDLGEGKTALIICDVSGKGVPASLLMVMIRTIVRSISSSEKHSDQIMTELNHAVTGKMGADRFATISVLILDTKEGVISYSNGAHHPLYILRGATRKYRMFDTDGLPLGIDAHASFGHKKIRIHSKDYLILFTDGLPEARNLNGEELGTNRLLQFIARHSDQNPEELTKRVKNYIEDFTSGAKHDDQTFISLKVG